MQLFSVANNFVQTKTFLEFYLQTLVKHDILINVPARDGGKRRKFLQRFF